MKGQLSLFIGGTPEKGYSDYKPWYDYEAKLKEIGQRRRKSLLEIMGYEIDVHAHITAIAPYLMAEETSLQEYAESLQQQWQKLVEDQQADSGDAITGLSILHGRLQFVANGTESEPEAVVAYFVNELGDFILSHEIQIPDEQW